MNSYKAATSKLNNNSLKIGSEIVSIKVLFPLLIDSWAIPETIVVFPNLVFDDEIQIIDIISNNN